MFGFQTGASNVHQGPFHDFSQRVVPLAVRSVIQDGDDFFGQHASKGPGIPNMAAHIIEQDGPTQQDAESDNITGLDGGDKVLAHHGGPGQGVDAKVRLQTDLVMGLEPQQGSMATRLVGTFWPGLVHLVKASQHQARSSIHGHFGQKVNGKSAPEQVILDDALGSLLDHGGEAPAEFKVHDGRLQRAFLLGG